MFALKPLVTILCVGMLMPVAALGESLPSEGAGEQTCCCAKRTERPCCTEKQLPAIEFTRSCGCQVRVPAQTPERKQEQRTGEEEQVGGLASSGATLVAPAARSRQTVTANHSPIGSGALPLRILHCSWQI